MNCEKLDVFVLTYNRAKYLRIMLESLCTQTATGFKIKVLNNCSTDNTLEVVKEIQDKYPDRNIEVITNEKNLGNTGNFKRSQEIAENEYTAIFHDDDAVHPEYIETAMSILNNNKNIVMCSGGALGLFNVDNSNWNILYKSYFLYPQYIGSYLNLLVGRPIFASNIYKTKVYKSVQYHPEKYGKLHDIYFMMEINDNGPVAFIQGTCLRWRQHPKSDSNSLSTGPFPDEICNLLLDIKRITKKHKFLGKPLLWNFAYFLYKWAVLKKYLTWNEMCKKMKDYKIFNSLEIFLFKRLSYINFFNNLITKRANYYRKKTFRECEDARF